MTRNYKFWISLALFEIAFGIAVFALTRQYYLEQPAPVDPRQSLADNPIATGSGNITAEDLARFDISVPAQPVANDPIEISRRANDYFANADYGQAAALYERLLPFDPGNADTYNNLGITLHYLGRSDEALARLNEGIAADPSHQRIWLTLGFINSQLGNTDAARSALTTALEIGDDDAIRRSASEMLEELQ